MFKRRTVLFSFLSSATTSLILLNCFISSTPASELLKLNQDGSFSLAQNSQRWSGGRILEIGERQEGHRGTVYAVAVSPDSRFIASGGVDQRIKIWDVQNRSLHKTYRGSNQIKSLAFNPNGRLLASGDVDGNIALWDLASSSQEPIQIITNHAKSPVSSIAVVAFHPYDDVLATSGSDGIIRLWDTQSNQLIREIEDEQSVYALTFSPDGKHLASGGSGDFVNIRDWSNARIEDTINPDGGSVLSLDFHPTDSLLAVGVGLLFLEENTIGKAEIWDLKESESLNSNMIHTGDIVSVKFNSTGQVLATASTDRTVKLWDVNNQNLLDDLGEHFGGRVSGVVFSPNDQYLVSASADGMVRIWMTE